jgi:hypothetical protein
MIRARFPCFTLDKMLHFVDSEKAPPRLARLSGYSTGGTLDKMIPLHAKVPHARFGADAPHRNRPSLV